MRIYLYAFDDLCRVVGVRFVKQDDPDISILRDTAKWMADTNPYIVKFVYALMNRPGLYQEFKDSIRGNFTKWIEFKDVVESEGMLVYQD
jgi:hypothetical protein